MCVTPLTGSEDCAMSPSLAIRPGLAVAAVAALMALLIGSAASNPQSRIAHPSWAAAVVAETTALLNPFAHDGYLSLKGQPAAKHARLLELSKSSREGNYAEMIYVFDLPLLDYGRWGSRTLELTVRDIPGQCRTIVDSYLWSAEW
jgi:hypothetical protein